MCKMYRNKETGIVITEKRYNELIRNCFETKDFMDWLLAYYTTREIWDMSDMKKAEVRMQYYQIYEEEVLSEQWERIL